jgi:hypothetical protein
MCASYLVSHFYFLFSFEIEMFPVGEKFVGIFRGMVGRGLWTEGLMFLSHHIFNGAWVRS